MRGVAVLVALLLGGVAVAWLLGPREPVDTTRTFDSARLGADLDVWLAEQEAQVPALREGSHRRIVWAGAPGVPTDIAVVYVHGFSASSEEIRPVPDLVAERLGANLHFTRLSGHGRDGAAMAEPTAGDWIEDMAEALAIGRRIGDRVLLIGTSTGGTLAKIAAHDPDLSQDLAGIVFVSPNFRVMGAGAGLLTAPWARHWLPLVIGPERGFVPIRDGQAAHWTTRYPSVSVLPMAALVDHARRLDPSAARLPALFLYSADDRVVSPFATADIAHGWGGAAQSHLLVMGPGDDPAAHVVAGDIMSPGQTDLAVSLIVEWAEGL